MKEYICLNLNKYKLQTMLLLKNIIKEKSTFYASIVLPIYLYGVKLIILNLLCTMTLFI